MRVESRQHMEARCVWKWVAVCVSVGGQHVGPHNAAANLRMQHRDSVRECRLFTMLFAHQQLLAALECRLGQRYSLQQSYKHETDAMGLPPPCVATLLPEHATLNGRNRRLASPYLAQVHSLLTHS